MQMTFQSLGFTIFFILLSNSFYSALLKESRHKGCSFIMPHICITPLTWGYENNLQMLIKGSTSVKW